MCIYLCVREEIRGYIRGEPDTTKKNKEKERKGRKRRLGGAGRKKLARRAARFREKCATSRSVSFALANEGILRSLG